MTEVTTETGGNRQETATMVSMSILTKTARREALIVIGDLFDDEGRPFFDHLTSVADTARDLAKASGVNADDAEIVAWLHLLTEYSIADIATVFAPRHAEAVHALRCRMGETETEEAQRTERCPGTALVVRLAWAQAP